MIYKFDKGGIVKLQNAGSIPEYNDIEQIAKYNREHGTNFYKMSQVLEHDKQQALQKSQNKKSFWEILAGHPESSGEAILNKAIETANNAELPETRSKIYNDTGKAQLATTAGSLLTLPMLGEFSTYGLLGGASRLAGGFGGATVGSYTLGKAGELGDRTFGTTWMKPAGQIIGGFAGWGPGSNIAYKGALNLASKAPNIIRIGATNRFIGDVAGRALRKNVDKSIFRNYTVYHGGEFLGDVPNMAKGNEFGFHVSTDKNVAQQLVDRGVSGAHEPIARNKGVVREGVLTTVGEPLPTWDWGTWSAFTPNNLFNGPKGFKFNKRFLKRKGITWDGLKEYQKEFWRPEVAVTEPKANDDFARFLKEHAIQAIEYPNVFEGSSTNKSFAVIDPNAIVLDKHLIHIPTVPKDLTSTVHFDPRVKPLSRPISEAEKLGIPKGERSNSQALENPQYWGYQQWNSRYNAAVESGNIEEAQRLRDLHFKIKSPNSPQYNFYHGTFNKDKPFYIFEPQSNNELFFHFSPYKDTAEKFMGIAKTRNENGRLITAKLNIQHPTMVTDSGWWNWYRIPEANPRISKTLGMDGPTAGQYYSDLLLKEPSASEANGKMMDILGNDAFMYKNYTEDVGRISVAVPRPSQIKLADPITRTNTGEIIPIVKRDNFHNPDIRYKQGGILKAQHGTGLAGIPIIGNLAKKAAYKIVTNPDVAYAAGATPKLIVKSLFSKNQEDDNKKFFLYGVERPYRDLGEAYNWQKDVDENGYKNVKSYEGVLNPYGEYLIDSKNKHLVEDNLGKDLLININSEYTDPNTGFISDSTPYFDDVHGYRLKFHKDENGNIVASASDLYDFGKNYSDGFSNIFEERSGNKNGKRILEMERNALNAIGKPYILTNEYPVRFVDNPKGEELMRVRNLEGEILSNKKSGGILSAQKGTPGFVNPFTNQLAKFIVNSIPENPNPVKVIKRNQSVKVIKDNQPVKVISTGNPVKVIKVNQPVTLIKETHRRDNRPKRLEDISYKNHAKFVEHGGKTT